MVSVKVRREKGGNAAIVHGIELCLLETGQLRMTFGNVVTNSNTFIILTEAADIPGE